MSVAMTKTMRAIYISAFTVALFISGCSILTPSIQPLNTSASVTAYELYVGKRAQVNTDSLIALVAYTSSTIQRTSMRSLQDFTTLFNAQEAYIKQNKKIAVNYAVAPTAADLQVWQQFNAVWISDMLANRVSPERAKQQYLQSATDLIFRITDNVYTRK